MPLPRILLHFFAFFVLATFATATLTLPAETGTIATTINPFAISTSDEPSTTATFATTITAIVDKATDSVSTMHSSNLTASGVPFLGDGTSWTEALLLIVMITLAFFFIAIVATILSHWISSRARKRTGTESIALQYRSRHQAQHGVVNAEGAH